MRDGGLKWSTAGQALAQQIRDDEAQRQQYYETWAKLSSDAYADFLGQLSNSARVGMSPSVDLGVPGDIKHSLCVTANQVRHQVIAVVELFLPPRANAEIQRYGCLGGTSFDILTVNQSGLI